ncbi:MAG: response regulator [Chloroflexi bacterium]|nr:response regulator [Chloroflexota bacterium]
MSNQELGPTLLIVEDDDMVREAIQRMLFHLGYQTIAASSGEAALEIFESSQTPIAAVILDMTMPGLSGIQTFYRLREIDTEVRVIVSTGDPYSPAVEELEAHRLTYVIAKPFQAEELARAIQQALS